MPARVPINPDPRQQYWWHPHAGAGWVQTALGWGLHSHLAGGGGELNLDPAKSLETQGLRLLILGVTSTCVTQCWTLPQLWGECGTYEDGVREVTNVRDTQHNSQLLQPGMHLPLSWHGT